MRMSIFSLAAVAALAVLADGGATAAAQHETAGVRRPAPPPALPPACQFVRTIDNPWFPLRPGTVLTYKGEDEGTPARDVLRVTHRTKRIQGIRATVIDDRVYENGRVVERTQDYYAQDRKATSGTSARTPRRSSPTARSKAAKARSAPAATARGRHLHARPPRPGDGGWQEYYVGHAQDRFKILNTHTRLRTPAAQLAPRHAVRETTPLEPGVVDHKLYVRGIGTVREETVKGGNERFELVSVRHR